MILLKKHTAKLLMRLRLYCYKSPKTGFLIRGPIDIIYAFYHERLENKMRNLIIVKYDNSDRIVIDTVYSKHLQCVCRHTKSYPADTSDIRK